MSLDMVYVKKQIKMGNMKYEQLIQVGPKLVHQGLVPIVGVAKTYIVGTSFWKICLNFFSLNTSYCVGLNGWVSLFTTLTCQSEPDLSNSILYRLLANNTVRGTTASVYWLVGLFQRKSHIQLLYVLVLLATPYRAPYNSYWEHRRKLFQKIVSLQLDQSHKSLTMADPTNAWLWENRS